MGLMAAPSTPLAIDPLPPTTLYAGTLGGVFKSTDGGVSWRAVNSGLTSFFVTDLVIDPLTPTTLYAGTLAGGVFKSTDGGGNWSAVNVGLTKTYVRALAIDPLTPTTLYAGRSGGHVFKSTNGGGSWSALNSDPAHRSIVLLAIDPLTSDTLYSATEQKVYKSNRRGQQLDRPVSLPIARPGDRSVDPDYSLCGDERRAQEHRRGRQLERRQLRAARYLLRRQSPGDRSADPRNPLCGDAVPACLRALTVAAAGAPSTPG